MTGGREERHVTPGVVTRIWRQGFAEWWAELWTLTTDRDPPPPSSRLGIERAARRPVPPTGLTRRGIELRHTRRAARRAAREMRRRWYSEEPPDFREELVP